MGIQGNSYKEVTEELKEDFLDLIAQGYTRPEAAAALGASARVLRAICNPKAMRYDNEFAKKYAKLTEKDGEHETALVERLRTAGIERAIRSSDRLLEKYSIIHDPDWAVHRPQAMQLNFNADKMAVMLPELSTETLEQMAREIEQKRRRELDAGDIIDVDPS